MVKQGNDDRLTYNLGHDVAKTRLASKLRNGNNGSGGGFDIYKVRKALLSHNTIKQLVACKAIAIGEIVGQNFTIGAVDSLYSHWLPCNKVNKAVTTISVVNNIITAILEGMGFGKYGKTYVWKTLDSRKYRYSKRIQVGADILSLDWIKQEYSREQFTCQLSDRQKVKKYQR